MAMLFNKRILLTQLTILIILFLPSCNNEFIKVSNLQFFTEAKVISSRTIKPSNLFSHFPEVVSRNDTALREWLTWDTTSTEDCYRDSKYILIVTDKDTIHKFLNDVYFLNHKIHDKGYCDTVKNIDKAVHIVPDLENFDIPKEKFRLISCESIPGDFWKVPNKCFRPECLGKWKHGYSKGIGIFNEGKSAKKVYWVYVW
jgi:hypothetical protein